MKFDEALNRLEDIVQDLEKVDVSVEEALSLYEEGIKLVKFCSKKLSEIEKKIEVITKDEDGNLKAKTVTQDMFLKEDTPDDDE